MIEQDFAMDAAMARADRWAVLPWQSPIPGEEEEEAEVEERVSYGKLAHLQELILSFAFADGDPRRWEAVALRMVAVMRRLVPSVLVGRDLEEVSAVAAMVPEAGRCWGLEEFVQLTEGMVEQLPAAELLERWYPREKSRWLWKGTKRVYLMARAFQPLLPAGVREKKNGTGFLERDFSYNELAGLFGEVRCGGCGEARWKFDHAPKEWECESCGWKGGPWSLDLKAARARWSALAKRVVRDPVEASGMICELSFSKRSETRELYRQAALGNRNRLGRPDEQGMAAPATHPRSNPNQAPSDAGGGNSTRPL